MSKKVKPVYVVPRRRSLQPPVSVDRVFNKRDFERVQKMLNIKLRKMQAL